MFRPHTLRLIGGGVWRRGGVMDQSHLLSSSSLLSPLSSSSLLPPLSSSSLGEGKGRWLGGSVGSYAKIDRIKFTLTEDGKKHKASFMQSKKTRKRIRQEEEERRARQEEEEEEEREYLEGAKWEKIEDYGPDGFVSVSKPFNPPRPPPSPSPSPSPSSSSPPLSHEEESMKKKIEPIPLVSAEKMKWIESLIANTGEPEIEQPAAPKSLTIAVLGCPNSGKSTLLNRLTGKQISSVSQKAHTTRELFSVVKNIDNIQLVYLDTPGVGFSDYAGGKREFTMAAFTALREVDLALMVIDTGKPRDIVLNRDVAFHLRHIESVRRTMEKQKEEEEKPSVDDLVQSWEEDNVEEDDEDAWWKQNNTKKAKKSSLSPPSPPPPPPSPSSPDLFLNTSPPPSTDGWMKDLVVDVDGGEVDVAGDGSVGHDIGEFGELGEFEGGEGQEEGEDDFIFGLMGGEGEWEGEEEGGWGGEVEGEEEEGLGRLGVEEIDMSKYGGWGDGRVSGERAEEMGRELLKDREVEKKKKRERKRRGNEDLEKMAMEKEEEALALSRDQKLPVIVCLNKVDMIGRGERDEFLYSIAKELQDILEPTAVFATSALHGKNVAILQEFLLRRSVPRPWDFGKDEQTTLTLVERVEHAVRSELFKFINNEVPYNVIQENISCVLQRDGQLAIVQTLWVTKKSQVAMIKGKKGSVITKIEMRARKRLEDSLGVPVKLILSVRFGNKSDVLDRLEAKENAQQAQVV